MFGFLFLSSLHAADAAPQQSNAYSLVPLVLIMVVFYFLLIRPQQKKEKERVSMISAIKSGDKIVTNGGIVGVVRKASNDNEEIEVEIADNTVIKLLKSHIVENRSAPKVVPQPKAIQKKK